MSAHRKDPDPGVTQATYDERGHIGAAQRVVITKPVRNWFAFFALAGSLVSFVIFSWFMVVLIVLSAALGYMTSQTDVREGKYCSVAALVLIALSLLHHI